MEKKESFCRANTDRHFKHDQFEPALTTFEQLKAEEKAAKLPATLTVPLIVFILPTLFIVLLGPAVLKAIDGLGGL